MSDAMWLFIGIVSILTAVIFCMSNMDIDDDLRGLP